MDLSCLITDINPSINFLFGFIAYICTHKSNYKMIGRREQIQLMQDALKLKKSSFIAITGRRRVGKTHLVREIYSQHFCFSVTGIQNGTMGMQLANFVQKINEYQEETAPKSYVKNWHDAFLLLKNYLKSLPKNKKQVIFIDELPWIATAKSGFIQLLAHLWNDYLSYEKHFILVVCGSATSWITNKIINDKGGFHNRVTIPIHLKPFTLAETKLFFKYKNIQFTDTGIAEIYMTLGGLPYYLEQIKKGESPTKAIERLCFEPNGILKNEYHNLYKALFDNWEYHEDIVQVLAKTQKGLTRIEILEKTKISAGGNFNRAINDLLLTDFVAIYHPFGSIKRESIYKLTDEFSVFYHRFMKENAKKDAAIWQTISQSQKYKIWKGFAFESLCLKHIEEIKNALGIRNLYSENSSFFRSKKSKDGFQIDLIIDRKDAAINLCECKFYESNFEITKKYSEELKLRKVAFREETQTKKMLLNTLIANENLIENEYSLELVDHFIHLSDLM
jgi:uncharacterized protein